jgi:hypothetical protein
MALRSKLPRDTNQLAKSIADIATGKTQIDDVKWLANGKNPAAVLLGRLGGKKGGEARAKALSASERRAIALKGARARWKK